MNIRSISLAAFAVVALAACTKPADTPAVDSSAPANATPTVVPTDSAMKLDSTAPTPATDSAKPAVDSTKPAK